MNNLAGSFIEYTYDGADSYRVSFGEGTATWLVLSGAHVGETREEQADIVEVAEGIWFVSWLEPTLEVVSFVANLNNKHIDCSYYFDGERHFWRGDITAFAPVSAD